MREFLIFVGVFLGVTLLTVGLWVLLDWLEDHLPDDRGGV